MKIPGYLALMVLFIGVYLVFAVGQFQLAFLSISWERFLAGIGETIMTDLHHMASYYFFLLLIVIGKDYFEERTNAVIRKEQLETELSKTQLLVLQRQIQPHFLFNTLNNVVAIIDERKEVAQEMLVELGELLRMSMELDMGQQVPLKQEFEILRLYLSIEKKRFEHQLHFELDMTNQSTEITILPFLLQPLVENGIKHGFKKGISQVRIEVKAWTDTSHLHLEIRNDGIPVQSQSFGIGLQNVQDRLATSYGEQSTMVLKNQDGWVVNKILIPL